MVRRGRRGILREGGEERNEIPEGKPQRTPLDSLLRHRDGLTVFVDNAAVDNNAAERGLRGVGRKLSSQSVDGAQLARMLHSVFGTLEMVGVSPYRWLLDYLEGCARHAAHRLKVPLPGCHGAPANSAFV